MIGSNNNIGNIHLGDTYSASESSSIKTKRKANDDFEEITKTKKPCQSEYEGNTEEINSILGKWNKFLENKGNFHPFSPVAAAVAAEFGAAKTDFCDGEVCLEVMSTQFKALNMLIDGCNKYNADGLIRMYGYKNLEILLLETSSHFGCSDQSKSKFDHHKGLFGPLAMIKTIADEYQYASITTVKKAKVIFVHASDTTVYLWSMSFVSDESIYELWLEDILEIKPGIDDKLEAIPNFIQFYWKTKELLKQTSRLVMELKKEHEATLVKSMFKKSSDLTSLSTIVNPSILRLIDDEDKASMAELGPVFKSRGE